MSAGVSLDQLLKRETILGTIERYRAPGNLFCEMYGLGIMAPAAQQIFGNAGQYDIFDGTRSMATFSSPGAPPTRRARKPIGSVSITVPRIYETAELMENELLGTRELGQNPSAPITGRGLSYYKRQIRNTRTRMDTTHEFMATRMVLGGFGMKPLTTGSPVLVPCETSDPAVVITNSSKVTGDSLGTANGIFTDKWNNPGTDIVMQLNELQVMAARRNGRNLRDIWVNGNTAKHLVNLEVLRNINGIANRVFSARNPTQQYTADQKVPDTGYIMEFGALPGWRFIVYNQGYVLPGTAEDIDSQTSTANWRPFIPDGKALILPAMGEMEPYMGMVAGSELMRWNHLQATSEMVYGFGVGTEFAIEPPRIDTKLLYNGAPVILEPNAVYGVDVL